MRMNSYSIFVGLIVCVLLAVGVWFFAPKGENQTYVVLTPPSSDLSLTYIPVSGAAPESSLSPPATSCGVGRPSPLAA